MNVAVIGAGICGLSSALRLREAGHQVEIIDAGERFAASPIAAALWYPYRALPQAAVTRWSAATYSVLVALASSTAAAGVRLRTGRELLRESTPDPWWRDAVPTLDRVPAVDVPAGYADGFRLTVPVVDPTVHLPWLREQLADRGDRGERGERGERGVRWRYQHVTGLAAAAPAADVTVNCTGLGAQQLGDDAVVPVRWQVILVEQAGVDEWLLDQSDPLALTYVVPREHTVVLGGTAEVGATSTEPDQATAAAIRNRCAALVPAVASGRVLAHKVGLRPTRPAVRLELERLPGGQPVVHNYGHGGAGWTLSYGCAEDVARLVGAL